MKKTILFVATLALVALGALWFMNSTGGTYPLPKVLDSNARGQLLALPVVTTEKQITWKPEWVPASQPGQDAVQQALASVVEELEGAPVSLSVMAHKGLASREQIAQRLGEALSQNGVGRYQLQPLNEGEQQKVGVVLNCAVADSAVAKKLLGALSPYLGGRVALLYGAQPAGEMTLELLGTPFFNSQGQATFDPNMINRGNE
ncbi:hypothetical protein [Halioxenophilus aromaticivorans]|uniref:GerMN domain-containing protein n=1 Tax=Halioxenophilus aromaticivorans TaxID=1306992 RepID=A0AAV3U9T7_9ALTE